MAHKKYTLIPTQKALAKKSAENLSTHGACMLVSDPATGKTRISGYIYSKLPDYTTSDVLVIHVAPSAPQAVAQAKEVGSFQDRPFGAAQKTKLFKQLKAQGGSKGYGATVVTMTPQGMQNLLKAAVEAPDKAETSARPENVPALSKESLFWEVIAVAKKAGITTVVLSPDEVHAMYRTTRATVPKNVAKLRDMMKRCFPNLSLLVLGITATPLFDVDGADPRLLKNASLMFGSEGRPEMVECTPDQAASIMAELKPNAPELEHEEVKLTKPTCKTWDMDEEVGEIGNMLVEQACEEKVPIQSKVLLKEKTATIVAKQAAHPTHGIFSKLSSETVGVKVMTADGTFKDGMRMQNAILACDKSFNTAATNELIVGLSSDGDDGMRKCEIVDLSSTDPAGFTQQLGTFKKETDNAESGNVLGLISMSQTQGTNDFATGVGAVIAVGNGFDSQKRKQFEGRIDRPATYEEGDVMYKKAKVVHVSSEWVGKVDSVSRIPVPKRATEFDKSEVGTKLDEIVAARAVKIAEETGCSKDEAEDQVNDSKEFLTMFNTAYRLWKIGPEFVMHDDDDKAARSRLALAYLEKRVAALEKRVAAAGATEEEADEEEGSDDEELRTDKPLKKAQDIDSQPDSDDSEDDAVSAPAAAPATSKKAAPVAAAKKAKKK